MEIVGRQHSGKSCPYHPVLIVKNDQPKTGFVKPGLILFNFLPGLNYITVNIIFAAINNSTINNAPAGFVRKKRPD